MANIYPFCFLISSRFLKRWKVLCVIFILASLKTNAQTETNSQDNAISTFQIASPTAASLAKFGDIPVSRHTGIPEISIPIYDVKCGSLSLPISMSYHASGLKAMEPAGWVGAGWALNAGGVITRSVMGGPDERGYNTTSGHYSDFGFNSYLYTGNVAGGSIQDYFGFATGVKDGEPDLFFFNFPGYSGKFYFRDDRTPVIVPEQDLRIVPTFTGASNQAIQGFVIMTPDGAQYSFGNVAVASGVPPFEVTNPIDGQHGLSQANTISSWFLSSVSSADNQFRVSLSYAAESYGFHTLSLFPIDGGIPLSGSPFELTTGYNVIKNIVQGVRLSSITFGSSSTPFGSISFTSGAFRTDLSDAMTTLNSDNTNTSARSLGSINISSVFNGTSTLLRSFNFSYGYFTDNTTPLATSLGTLLLGGTLQTDRQRLQLSQIQEVSGDGTVTNPPYKFTYFSEPVLRRLCFGVDHWGFMNGVSTNSGLFPPYTVVDDRGATTPYPGATRDASWPAMRGGTLQQITYPTGGNTLFEFEPNQVYATKTSTSNFTLLDIPLGLKGQGTTSKTLPFTSTGGLISASLTNTANYSGTLTVYDANNVVEFTITCGNPQSATPLTAQGTFTVPSGSYHATLAFDNNGTGTIDSSSGIEAVLTQYHTSTDVNPVIVGGLRIKTITSSSGSNAPNLVTSYSYLGANGQSSGILYSVPVYVGILRNDLIMNVGYWSPDKGFTPPAFSFGGCPSFPNASYFKSTTGILPLVTTQGNHIGYSQVTESHTGNGYSVYQYYATTGSPNWQEPTPNVTIQTVNIAGCDIKQPSFPYAPVQFDYLRGELKYQATYSQAGTLLKDVSYVPTFSASPILTPAFKVVFHGITYFATPYNLSTAHKVQTAKTENFYTNGLAVTTTSTSYNESVNHHEITRSNSTNSKGEVLETRTKYAFDFPVAACQALADGSGTYNAACAACQTAYNTARAGCAGDNSLCLTSAYLNYLQCQTTARINFVAYRKTNFVLPGNTFQSDHDAASSAAFGLLKPVLKMQDSYMNPPIEITKWNSGNLIQARFNEYNFEPSSGNGIYISQSQALLLASPSSTFTPAAPTAAATDLALDARYVPLARQSHTAGNVVKVTPQSGVPTSYIWGYGGAYPVAEIKNADTNEVLVQNFEDSPSAIVGNAHTGKKYSTSSSISFTSPTSRPYVVSYWYRKSGIWNYSQEQVYPAGATSFTMKVETGIDGYDDIRIYPADSQVSTYTFSPQVGMTSRTDPKGKTAYYEYDPSQRLKNFKDQDGNIVSSTVYHYQVQ